MEEAGGSVDAASAGAKLSREVPEFKSLASDGKLKTLVNSGELPGFIWVPDPLKAKAGRDTIRRQPLQPLDNRGVAVALCRFVDAKGGEVYGTKLAEFYKADGRRKPVIDKAKKLSRFLELPEVAGLLRYDGSPSARDGIRIRRTEGGGGGGGGGSGDRTSSGRA